MNSAYNSAWQYARAHSSWFFGRMNPRLIESKLSNVPALAHRTRDALEPHGQGFRVPVWNRELRLLQRHHVRKFVPQHPRPVEFLTQIVRRRQGNNLAGASSHGADERQPGHEGAETVVAADAVGRAEDLEERLLRRLEAEHRDGSRIDLLFEVLRSKLGQQLIALRVVLDHEGVKRVLLADI